MGQITVIAYSRSAEGEAAFEEERCESTCFVRIFPAASLILVTLCPFLKKR